MKQKTTSTKYRLRNWSQYTTALMNRGSLTIWFDVQSRNQWINRNKSDSTGRPNLYADAAVECCLMLRDVFHLPLRQTQGLVGSLIHLLGIDLPVPHYSTLSRRAARLRSKLHPPSITQPLHLLIDSSGFKVYGEGEWYMRLRKQVRRRTWRKLHIAVDHQSGLVVSAVGSHKEFLDRDALGELLAQTQQAIKAVYADGAYDYKVCYKAIWDRGSEAIIPPKQRGVLHMQEWMRSAQSQHKADAEARPKKVFSDRLRSKRTDTQDSEMLIRCEALNRMTSLGMPDSYAV